METGLTLVKKKIICKQLFSLLHNLLQTASSGRMVELLGGEMGAGVIGFETVSSGLLQRGAGGGNRSSEGAVGGGGGVGGGGEDVSLYGAGTKFQVVMKQLGKKDTTTKLKVGLKKIHIRSPILPP